MSKLSPNAQAVSDAVERQLDIDASFRPVAAAAIRAAADQVVPQPDYMDSCCEYRQTGLHRKLLAIATELEAIE
jgi:hypothetical protein